MEQAATVEKALEILFHLYAQGPRTLSATASSLGLPRTTAHRLLRTLEARGLVERGAGGGYAPGLALASLALAALREEPLVAALRPELERAAESLGETVLLAGARAGTVRVLDVQESTGFLRAVPRVGGELPAHATAARKLFLAHDAERVTAPDSGWPRYTLVTRVEREALEWELTAVRERGFSIASDEWLPGLSDLAVPILLGGRLAGALSVSGPTSRFQSARQETFLDHVRGVAERVAYRLGSRG